MNLSLQFTVFGTPIPKGSTRSFAIARLINGKRVYTGKTVNVQSNEDDLRPYEAKIRDAAIQAGARVVTGPVVVNVAFGFRRPKNHFGSGKNAAILKVTAPEHHTKKPDADKLLRSILDGLTNVVYADDAQVVRSNVVKQWCYGPSAEPRATIEVQYL
jgi:crossover junction endodeoxyribonuclease RusA